MHKTLVFSAFSPLCTTLCARMGEHNTLSQASMLFATMPKTLAFTAFLPFCTTYSTSMWKKQSCQQRPCLWRPCPKHWYLRRFRLFVQHTAQGCVVTSVHAAQKTGIYPVSPCCTTYSARMWNKKSCHKRPCLWRPGAEHQCLQRLCLFAQLTKGLGSGLTQCISETETQCNSKNQAAKKQEIG